MEKCKTKALQEDLGILMHIPNAGIFTTSSEPSYIQNFRIFITLACSEPEAYSELCQNLRWSVLQK